MDSGWQKNFDTQKFVHHMDYKPIKQLRFKKDSIGIEGKKGYATEWNAKQKFVVPEAIKKVKLKVYCLADKYNGGGSQDRVYLLTEKYYQRA